MGGKGTESATGGNETPAVSGTQDLAPKGATNPDLQEFVRKSIQDAMAPVLKQLNDLPGMTKRIAAETAQSAASTTFEQINAAKSQTQEVKSQYESQLEALQERVRKQEMELDATRKANLQEKRANEVLKQPGLQDVLESAAPMVVRELTNMVKTKQDGSLYMTVTQRLAAIGETIKKDVSVQEGVRLWLKEHPDLVRVKVTGGVGASARAEGRYSGDSVGYQELFDNPAKMTAFIREHGTSKLSELRRRWEANKRKR